MSEAHDAQLGAVLESAGYDRALAGPILRGQRDLPAERRLALVAIDPLGIQETVLASRRPVTRAGASQVLQEWDDHLRNLGLTDGPRYWPIYAGGGQALLLTPSDGRKALADRLRGEFRHRYLGELGVASIDVSPADLGGLAPAAGGDAPLGDRRTGFGALVARLGALLRADKDRGRPLRPVVRGLRCDECGVEQGTKDHQLDGEQFRLCPRCDALHARGSTTTSKSSFQDLGDRELAYLAIDGTDVGRRLGEQDTIEQYRRCSATLLHAFDRAKVLDDIRDAQRGAGVTHTEEGEKPAIVLIAGGDDLLVVLRGDACIRVVLAVIAGIHRRLDEGGLTDVGVGAGLVITRQLHARAAFQLAGDLLRSAKRHARRARRADPGARSGFDFEVVRGGGDSSDSLATLRDDRNATFMFDTRRIRPLRRPFTDEEARRLVEVAHELTGEEVSAAYRLREQLTRDEFGSFLVSVSWMAARAREGQRLVRKLGGDAAFALDWRDGSNWLLSPDPEDPTRHRSAIVDLVDLHPYIGRAEVTE